MLGLWSWMRPGWGGQRPSPGPGGCVDDSHLQQPRGAAAAVAAAAAAAVLAVSRLLSVSGRRTWRRRR